MKESFIALQKELKELEFSIIDAGGEEEVENEYAELKELVEKKASNVAYILDNKNIDDNIQKAKDTKKEIDQYIKNLRRKKEYLESTLHKYIEENDPIQFGIEENKKYASACISVTNKVDTSLLEDDEKKYRVNIKKLSKDDLEALQGLLELELNCRYDIASDVGVKDLPKGHKALIPNIRPTIKFTKKKSS